MATIVANNRQPSWQEDLLSSLLLGDTGYGYRRANSAGGVLGGILGNFINKAIERSENAYNNKMLQAALSEINAANSPQPQTNYLTTPSAQQSTNGWENAFRQGTNVLTDFDNNTGNMATPLGITAQPVQANIPTMADANAALIRNAGHAKLSDLQALMNPYIQANEAARIEARKRAAGEALAGATGADRVSEAWRYYPEGTIPLEAVNAAQSQMIADRPQPFTLDTGGTFQRGTYDPVTGQFTNQDSVARTLTPQQVIENQHWDLNRKDTLDTRDLTRQDANASKYSTNVVDSNGYMYQVDQYGNIRPMIVNGTHLQAPRDQYGNFYSAGANGTKAGASTTGRQSGTVPKPGSLTQVENKQFGILNKNVQNLEKDLRDTQKIIDDPYTPKTARGEAEKRKAEIQAELKEAREARDDFLKSRGLSIDPTGQGQTTTSGDVAATIGQNLLGTGYKGTVSANGRFNVDRGDHPHGGLDFAMNEGSPITANEFLGSNLKVVAVSNNPDDTSKFGCHVRLEGTMPDGQKYYYIFGHMKKDSIAVKEGDMIQPGTVLGQVGNTGHSHGAHLHFEVKTGSAYGINNKMDPEKWFAQYYSQPENKQVANNDNAAPMDNFEGTQETTTQASNQGGNEDIDPDQRAESDVSPTLYRRESDGAEYSERQVQRWARKFITDEAKKGNTVSITDAEKHVGEYLENQGYKNVNLDETPIIWRGNGNTYITQKEYDDLLRQAENDGLTREAFERDYLKRRGFIPVNPTPQPIQTPVTINSDSLAINPVGIDSKDIAASTPNATTQSADVAIQPENNDGIALRNSKDPSDVVTQREIDEWEQKMKAGEQPTKQMWEDRGVYNRDDFIRYKISQEGYQPVNSDSVLANPLGMVGDDAHSPGPVHNSETSTSTRQKIDELNGLTSGDVNIGYSDSSRQAFQRPYGLGNTLGRMQNPYNIRRYVIG